MCLISSIALTADEDVLALSFYANETHFAIQLEDGVLSVLETDGKLLYTLQHKIWSKVAIADGKIIVAEDEEECVSIYNVGTGYVAFFLSYFLLLHISLPFRKLSPILPTLPLFHTSLCYFYSSCSIPLAKIIHLSFYLAKSYPRSLSLLQSRN